MKADISTLHKPDILNLRRLVYDAENRINYVDSGSTAQYVYDAFGRRVGKVAGATTTYYVYGPDGHVLSEFDANGNWNQTHVRLSGQLVALYNGSSTGFYHLDHLGTTRVVSLQDGSVHDGIDFLPYGYQIGGSGATSFRFTGKERDSESGLDNFGARQYSFAYERFMSVDPSRLSAYAENPQSFNRYSYAYGRPMTVTDPDGKCPPCILGAVAGGVLSGGVEAFLEYRATGHVNTRNVFAAAAGGAIAGGLSGGLSVGAEALGLIGTGFTIEGLAAAGTIGGVSNVVGGGIARGFSSSPEQRALSSTDIYKDFSYGFVGGTIGQAAGNLAFQEFGGAYNFRTTLLSNVNKYDSGGVLRSFAKTGYAATSVTAGTVGANVVAPIATNSYLQPSDQGSFSISGSLSDIWNTLFSSGSSGNPTSNIDINFVPQDVSPVDWSGFQF